MEIHAGFFAALGHAVFALGCLAFKQKRGAHDLVGAAWITITALAIMRRALLVHGPVDAWYTRMVGYPAAYGPLAFLYAAFLTEPDKRSLKDLVHFVPLVLLSALTVWKGDVFSRHTIEATGSDVRIPFTLLGTFALISLGAYSIASLRLLRRHAQRIREYYSQITPTRSLVWLNALNCIFLAYLLPLTLFHAGIVSPLVPNHNFTTLVFISYMMLISLFIVRQPPVLPSSPAAPGQASSVADSEIAESPQRPARYERSQISAARMLEIEARLKQLMEERRPYLNDDLNLTELAALLDISPHQLSQTLNVQLGTTFYALINEYRVREAERRLKDPAFDEYSILRIALESGFTSKSSFHAGFRKVNGISPGEYREKFRAPSF